MGTRNDAEKKSSSGADRADAWSRSSDAHVTDFKRERSPLGARLGALALWLIGLVIEVGSVLYATGDIISGELPVHPAIVIAIAVLVDLVLVLLAARIWRGAGKATERAKGTRSTGSNEYGILASCVAFVPMVAFFALSKNIEAATRVKAIAAAAITSAIIAAVAIIH